MRTKPNTTDRPRGKEADHLGRLRLGLGLAATLVVAFSVQLGAFKPWEDFGHKGIVENALLGGTWQGNTYDPIEFTSSTGIKLRFSRQAVQEIVQATGNVDNLAGEFWVGEAHCDDDLILECHRRLVSLKAQAIDAVEDSEARSGFLARLYSGRALHTLQDFYTHSNWVMTPGLGNTQTFFAALGVPGSDAQIQAILPADNLATCKSDGGTVAFSGVDKLTTGYFKAELGSLLFDKVVEPGRCNHGGGARQLGIHKDEPSRPFHKQARHVAVLATQAYVKQILDALDDGGKRAMMGIGGTLGFVIDETGSMGPEIAGVIASVERLVQSAEALPEDRRPGQYLLVRYADTTARLAVATDDPNVLLGQLRAIDPAGGGDCPEAAMTGLLEAIGASSRTGQIFLYTDADAKDSKSQGTVAFQANSKNVSVSVISSGRCGKEQDPAYRFVTQATGGQELILGSSETDKVFDIIAPTLTGDAQPLIDINDNLGAPRGAATKKTYNVPVDDTVTTLSISASIETLTAIDVIRPSGTLVRSSDADATITQTDAGIFATIKAPAAGTWKVRFEGSGELQLSAKGNSDVAFDDFDFVRETGRPGHEGFFPIVGNPLNGTATETRANVVGALFNPEFELRTVDGELIDPTTLSPVADSSDGTYGGPLNAPETDFRVYLKARTPAGREVQRVFPATYRGQPIDVASFNPAVTVSPSADTEIAFRVTNTGPTRTLDLTATEDHGLAGAPVPARVTLSQDESVVVRVPLRASGSTDLFEISSLTLDATDTTEPAIGNVGATNLVLEADSDGDGQADVTEQGPGGNRANYDGNGDGRADRSQGHVASFATIDGSRYGTATVSSGARFRGFQAAAAPGNEDGMQPIEGSWVRFTLDSLPGGAVNVRLVNVPFSGAQQFGPEPGRSDAVVYDFGFDGTTGARNLGGDLVVSYVDGGRGDFDGQRNGRIEALLGPGTTGGLAGTSCRTSASTLCLNASRFQVQVDWRDPFGSGDSGSGRAQTLSGDTGYFWFFDANNVELVVKVLDARALNGRFWVFYGALSNVEYTLTVTDTETGAVKTYTNPAGRFASVGDTDAFTAARPAQRLTSRSKANLHATLDQGDVQVISQAEAGQLGLLQDQLEALDTRRQSSLPAAPGARANRLERGSSDPSSSTRTAVGPTGTTYSFEPLLAADPNGDGTYDLYRIQDGPRGANRVTFDGRSERIGPYCCSLATTPRVTETLADRGNGRLDLRIVLSSVEGTDLFPGGFVSTGDRDPLDSAGLTIGFLTGSDPLDWSPEHRVLTASAEFLEGTRSLQTYDLTGFFGNGTWDGNLGLVFPEMAGEGTNRVVLDISVQEDVVVVDPSECTASSTRLCLADGRFAVEVQWRDPFGSGDSGNGRAAALTADTGTFWFFDPSNIELIVKVLDARSLNGRFWLFYGALSNVEYTLEVTDTETGAVKTYFNPAGKFGSRGDTSAF